MPPRPSPFRPSTALRLLPLALLLASAAAAAQLPATETRRSFAAGYFADSAPANAWEMLQRVPGFAVVDADADVRGYAAAQGNVLVDGALPASKHESLSDLLRRIPASAVERIELIRAGEGVDMGGYALLANIVRRAQPAPTRTFAFGLLAAGDGWRTPVGEFGYARQRDERTLELAFAREAEADEDGGRGSRRRFAADGALLEAADGDLRSHAIEHRAALAWSRPLAGGRLHLDLAALQERSDESERWWPTLAGGDAERSRDTEDLREGEIGLRWLRRDGDRRITAFASSRHGRIDAAETGVDEDGEESFVEDSRRGESLAGLALEREVTGSLGLGAAAEIALNRLDGRARLRVGGIEQPLPGADVAVRERRGELAFTASWRPRGHWRLDGGLRLEASRIGHADGGERDFFYLKPRIALAWNPTPAHTLRWAVAREVGQLDFGDFVASASLADGDVAAGAVDLVPDRIWRSTLAWEWDIGDAAGLQLAWIHERIDDVIDRVVVIDADGEWLDAPGNLGSGRRDAISLDFDTSLAALGLPSLQLDASLRWQRSRVIDPVTGTSRPVSGDKPREGEIALRQVLAGGRFHWGIEAKLAESEAEYRFDRVTRDVEGSRYELFAERRWDGGWRLRAEVTAPGQSVRRERERHDGPRDGSTFDGTERRRHRAPGMLLLTLRRDIGG
ncbi:TonB-dependent receptor plug domain-containing protein [Arenimonas composti]|uniref:TonB-dependent receptor-like beta-barrel domain-containing protein n=1 Tax=Arenimonas composti TR7-09 = DSM 18010 TaxID=1121013 RepID=A0A091BYP2_9GAMM|nr:TonB-dependent receptor [Arenimonas composti]KFN49450.1 hypothetical protein P873_10785 [Arenimonas composti TR7-09 = DSM 18010]